MTFLTIARYVASLRSLYLSSDVLPTSNSNSAHPIRIELQYEGSQIVNIPGFSSISVQPVGYSNDNRVPSYLDKGNSTVGCGV